MIGKLLAQRKTKRQARQKSLHLYQLLVTHARSNYFYLPPYNVEDTVEGRFELILIHLFMVDEWLSEFDNYILLRRNLQETLITDMDRSLREMGIGDMSVGKQMKHVGAALLGRLQSYRLAFENANSEIYVQAKLTDIFKRNVKGLEEPDTAMQLAGYMIRQMKAVSCVEVLTWQPGDPIFSESACQWHSGDIEGNTDG